MRKNRKTVCRLILPNGEIHTYVAELKRRKIPKWIRRLRFKSEEVDLTNA